MDAELGKKIDFFLSHRAPIIFNPQRPLPPSIPATIPKRGSTTPVSWGQGSLEVADLDDNEEEEEEERGIQRRRQNDDDDDAAVAAHRRTTSADTVKT